MFERSYLPQSISKPINNAELLQYTKRTSEVHVEPKDSRQEGSRRKEEIRRS